MRLDQSWKVFFSLFLTYSEFISTVEEDDVDGLEEAKEQLEEFNSHIHHVFVFDTLNFSCVVLL